MNTEAPSDLSQSLTQGLCIFVHTHVHICLSVCLSHIYTHTVCISVCLWQPRWSVSLLPACPHPPAPGSIAHPTLTPYPSATYPPYCLLRDTLQGMRAPSSEWVGAQEGSGVWVGYPRPRFTRRLQSGRGRSLPGVRGAAPSQRLGPPDSAARPAPPGPEGRRGLAPRRLHGTRHTCAAERGRPEHLPRKLSQDPPHPPKCGRCPPQPWRTHTSLCPHSLRGASPACPSLAHNESQVLSL